MSIQVSELSKVYGEQRAVDAISFELKKGEITGFLGPNGAGKSTTMKMITGFLPPTSGKASVCGFDIVSQSLEVRKRVGYLPESNPLYYDMYIREFLEFVAGIHQLGKAGAQRITSVIELTGLQPERHKKIGALSNGYKQRVGLAQALLHDPEVLILDEPTTGLDPNQLADIRRLIKELGANKTVILSTHIMQEVEALCDRVIIINKGKIIADDKLSLIQQNNSGNGYLQVTFAEPVSEAELMAIPGISRVVAREDHSWQLFTSQVDEVRKNLLQFALINNRNILSLQSNSQSLEAIFRELTLTKASGN
ncbi:ABC-2 type transport system ATP-binding protein [Chitinophaga ginsengisegetis]|uniref:ABC-2 type transport system ATP-binding protein n=1 Tax=Chitinophaga ginsengisegetis TaxID=393003 RepID=A0A1T5P4K3_9BACT|nr:gliding motility-associated ABC transporter ATP-binding subunit GldA [Chitinophaga ginsengisegetis]MDR6570325.1 ABC-2 type transport system ATP-binding protein [Chitinophaga ginsengisegetis]MDR6650059.1 ABC-2 type transport system ATP-binding protein [Chitinophaga ginsengisegetis]MDR6656300.1 ABC-2 type transport system ATP-binding protein [Chitinophaga ginsengisegetis]SKD07714.1 ABC-2 type transport system ATP-binding protein [Chitinophaga ginsengisegetis]